MTAMTTKTKTPFQNPKSFSRDPKGSAANRENASERSRHGWATTMVLTLATLGLASCGPTAPPSPAHAAQPLDAGPLTDFAREGTVDRFAQSRGVMLVTFAGRLTAMSAACTADNATLQKSGDGFVCPKDNSHFDRTGQAGAGKARDPLVHYPLSVNAAGRVTVDTNHPLDQSRWSRPEAYLTVR